jgi:hypothetical protein
MAYSKPLLADFRIKYPAFDAVADETVQAWIDEGDTETAGWPDTDRARAVMLYAAHRLAESGVLTGGVSVSGVTSFRSGTFSAQMSDSAASRTGFDATAYGRDFLALRRRNFIGLTTAWSPPACTAPGYVPGEYDV